MPSSLRERRRQTLHDEILDTSRTLMAERGYVMVSMDELAARVGISKPTLYSHFATKDDLVAAVVMHEMEQLLVLIEDGTDEQSPLERLRLLMRRLAQLILAEGTLALHSWTPELTHLMKQHEGACGYLRRMSAATAALISSAMICGDIDPTLDPATVMRAFYGLATSLKFAHFTREAATDPAVAADTLITIFERGVRSHPK